MQETTRSAPTLEALRARRDEIVRLAEHYGASHVRAFGSVARGDATEDSDIDLLVHFPDDRSIFELVDLWLDLKDLLGRDVSLVPELDPEDPFMRRIARDLVAL